MPYLTELITIATVDLLAVMLPGPDFAMICLQSIKYGRRTAIFTSIGLGLGVALHVGYCLLGVGILISQSIVLFSIIKYIDAGYLIYIGIQGIRANKKSAEVTQQFHINTTQTWHKSIQLGFLTNALNPKATLFFLALFTQVIDPNTPIFIQLGYGVVMIIDTVVWFSVVSLFLTIPHVKGHFLKVSHIIEKITGGVLIALGIKVALEHK